ncbi:ATP-dependent helicase HrpB [Colwellia sp. RSH04]|uniref:ATP-dependent helicase HrpB n=1 Tax=Colwellia sp. RSH04 TaxID=2305464 RepID=UPI000E57349C|nr:ATP-dependent helicase HrpB [Colwellia sp. RSH04]RHW77740.1 ATP-dependent helicase HrpB [Colwellia sp. RSH04]
MSVPSSLPIEAIKDTFCQTLNQHNTVILSAPPGAGKSTCLPLWLLTMAKFSQQKIYLLQPRRLAVKNIATFLASQLSEPVGKTIGYRVRNESKVSKSTRLEVITEGILTQLIQNDAELAHTALIVFDEFHERSLQGDLAFALAREVQQALREDLTLLLMSATLDISVLSAAIPDAIAIHSEGRSFSVDIAYMPANANQFWREHALFVIKQQLATHQGSILAFLPGVADIKYIATELSRMEFTDVVISPLYGELPLKEQQQAIQSCSMQQRKLVLATNIAETSLTIEGIDLVIDSGVEKVAIYNSATLTNKLIQRNIAKASAVQRAGRAGRLMPGKCIRLYAKEDFQRRPEQSTHAIQQEDLLPTIMEAARWGVNQLADLPMLELPKAIIEQQAWHELLSLNIINEQRQLTTHGEQVSRLNCHPRFAHMILSAKSNFSPQSQQVALACLITATLEERDIFTKEQGQYNCDFTLRLQALIGGSAQRKPSYQRIFKQARNLASALSIELNFNNVSLEHSGILLAFAFPERIAKSREVRGEYICTNGKGVSLNEDDVLAGEPYIVIADMMQLKSGAKVRLAASVSLLALEQYFSEKIIEKQHAFFDEKRNRIIQRKQRRFAAIVIEEQPLSRNESLQDFSPVWAEQIVRKGIGFLNWSKQDKLLIARWQWLAHYQQQDSKITVPSYSEAMLLEQLSLWFQPFVSDVVSKEQLDKLNLSTMLLSLFDYQQQQLLEQAAPTHYIGPTGRRCPITYSMEASPKVSLPMQELYGESVTPVIGIYQNVSVVQNKQGMPLLLELLSPAQRPIQLTQDLVAFWSGSYELVQKDMKSRYPKHYWPDDPANAKATNKTKRHIQP